MSAWSVAESRKLYNIERWGHPYFNINASGHVTVKPKQSLPLEIDLLEVAKQISEKNFTWPVLLRVTDILPDRVKTLREAFSSAINNLDYQGTYTPVYPVKVNQQRTVVEHILQDPYVGLESGSKPELMLVLSHARQDNSAIVCNGYKDREYIRLALIGQKIGHKVFIVIEKLSELDLILEESRALNIVPNLGLRIKLASVGKGNWQNSGGEKSKFGLSATQILTVLETLKTHNLLSSLKLIHCHLGSQLANIRDIQRSLQEVSRYYSEFRRIGADITHIDIGGGLGIDYEGSRSRNYCSMNYSVNEYANDVVKAFWHMCVEEDLPHPHIISESGRAMTAHHALLITNIIDSESLLNRSKSIAPATDNESMIIYNLRSILGEIKDKPASEAYHDAVHWLTEAQSAYTHGRINLEERALAEQIYVEICQTILTNSPSTSRALRELNEEINEKLASKYFMNLSIFQSMPDVWALDQIFPIMPLHRLEEKPEISVTLQDLTCDSDGCISRYVNYENLESTLPVHELRENEAYLVGIFLVGAYQEILGDMHNLFGDTHSVDLKIIDEHHYELVDAEEGDSIDEILRYVHFEPDVLIRNYQTKIEKAALSKDEAKLYFEELKGGITGYSYLED